MSGLGHTFLSKSSAHHSCLTYREIVNDTGALDCVLYALNTGDIRSYIDDIRESFNSDKGVRSPDIKASSFSVLAASDWLNARDAEQMHSLYLDLAIDRDYRLGEEVHSIQSYTLILEDVCCGHLGNLIAPQRAYLSVLMLSDYADYFDREVVEVEPVVEVSLER